MATVLLATALPFLLPLHAEATLSVTAPGSPGTTYAPPRFN